MTFSPSLTVTVSGCNLVEGFSVREQKYFSQLFGIPRHHIILLLGLLLNLSEVNLGKLSHDSDFFVIFLIFFFNFLLVYKEGMVVVYKLR